MRDCDEVVGFVALDGCRVEILVVHPDYRARGVGKRLTRYDVDVLGATNVDENEQNLKALSF